MYVCMYICMYVYVRVFVCMFFVVCLCKKNDHAEVILDEAVNQIIEQRKMMVTCGQNFQRIYKKTVIMDIVVSAVCVGLKKPGLCSFVVVLCVVVQSVTKYTKNLQKMYATLSSKIGRANKIVVI